jgi:antitoxin component YwqK of YwqJK toxin-antitoxin module
MKKYLVLGALLVSGLLSAQENQPKLTAEGELVKATYYYDNGIIQQEGFFKDGKAEGKWVSYDTAGTRKASGEYSQGEKAGKWFFWNKDVLSEVDYSDSRVAAVKNWKQEAIVIRN